MQHKLNNQIKMLWYHLCSTDKQIKLIIYILTCSCLDQITRRAAQYNKPWTMMMTYWYSNVIYSLLSVSGCWQSYGFILNACTTPWMSISPKVLSWTSEERAISQPWWGWTFMNPNGGLPVVHVHAVDWSDPFKLSANSSFIQHTNTVPTKGGRGGQGSISSSSAHRRHPTVWHTLIHTDQENY